MFTIFLAQCGNNKEPVNNKDEKQYEIVDKKVINDTTDWYTVYTPDTNWAEIEKFAKGLIKYKSKYSAVAFFHPQEKTPKMNEYFSLPKEAMDYVIVTYRLNDSTQKFALIKTPNRFKKEMHFE